jgi:hypothetical protein
MCAPRQTFAFLILVGVLGAASCRRVETLSPEAARAKGEELLRAMSQALSSTQSFSYTAKERREVPGGGETKRELRFTRHIMVRRPNALSVTDKGDTRDAQVWYDGKQLTLVAHNQKAWARGPMPGTLDEAIDFVSAEYAIQLPTADLLYSNPYDALMTPDTTGGWLGRQQVGELTCDHLRYSQPVVDWEIWLSADRHLPCQMKITYKTEPHQPVTLVTFSDWNPSPQLSADAFTPKVPDGYERLKIMRHATVEGPSTAPVDPTVPAESPKTRKPRE